MRALLSVFGDAVKKGKFADCVIGTSKKVTSLPRWAGTRAGGAQWRGVNNTDEMARRVTRERC